MNKAESNLPLVSKQLAIARFLYVKAGRGNNNCTITGKGNEMTNEANNNLMEEQPETGRVDEYLPYATDYINTACYCLEVLNGVDGKLFSKLEEQRMQDTKRRMMRIIHAASKAMHDDWFNQDEPEAG